MELDGKCNKHINVSVDLINGHTILKTAEQERTKQKKKTRKKIYA